MAPARSSAAFSSPVPVRTSGLPGALGVRGGGVRLSRRAVVSMTSGGRRGRPQPPRDHGFPSRRDSRRFPPGWKPEKDDDFVEVLVHGFGGFVSMRRGVDSAAFSVLLRPVGERGGKQPRKIRGLDAARMRLGLGDEALVRAETRTLKVYVAHMQAMAIEAAVKGEKLVNGRPSAHDLFSTLLSAGWIIVTKAAITHIVGNNYYARLWTRAPGSMEEVEVDARPSDALAMAITARAPVYVSRSLLARNGATQEQVDRDVCSGFVELTDYAEDTRTTSSLAVELTKKPDHMRIAKLRMAIDLNIRLERFKEVQRLRDELNAICPVDILQEQLKQAIREERYEDAAKIRDEIYKWRLEISKWDD